MTTNQLIAKLESDGYFRLNGSAAKFSQEEMKAAFDAVCDGANWKNPINAQVDPQQLCVTVAAIVHFAGSESYVKSMESGEMNLYAPGYYVRIGA